MGFFKRRRRKNNSFNTMIGLIVTVILALVFSILPERVKDELYNHYISPGIANVATMVTQIPVQK